MPKRGAPWQVAATYVAERATINAANIIASRLARKLTGANSDKGNDRNVIKTGAHTGITNSYTRMGYPKRRIPDIYEQIGNEAHYKAISAGSVATGATGNVNQQRNAIVGTYFTGTDIPFLFREQAGLIPPTPTPLGRYKLYLKSLRAETEFVNQTEANTIFDIYDIYSKIANETADTPLTDWVTGINSEVPPSGAITATLDNDDQFPGAKPTEFHYWNKRWGVVKHTTVELAPGGMHRHTFQFNPHRIMDIMDNTNLYLHRGLTVSTMVIARGTPADTVTNYTEPVATGALGEIHHTPVKVIWITRYKYAYSLLTTVAGTLNQQMFLRSYALPNSNNPATGLYQQNEDTGNPVNLADTDFVA